MQLRVDNLIVNFSAPEGGILEALGSISFTIEAGSFAVLLGPSGCGKSTLIRVIAGLQQPTIGKVRVDNEIITEPHDGVAMMFQDSNLMPWRTVHDNIALPLELRGIPPKERSKRVYDLLPALGLEEFAKAYPSNLSGGMAQRTALGRVLIQQPDVLLLDEPFGALDAMTREKISLDLLRLWADFQQTVLMVTHDINEAVLLADRVLVMSQRPGKLIADIDVPLKRPRTLEMVYTTTFVETARIIRQAIDGA
jgi:ABC-type nitrate/sulfonate/bicarbonate transport system ATPase subunit